MAGEKRIQNKKNDKKEKKKEDAFSREQITQFAFILVSIIVLFLAFLIPYYYIQNQKVFKYENLTWQVEKEESVTFYHTQFNKTLNGRFFGTHTVYFREDPRKNNIPVDVTNYAFYKNIVISSSPEVVKCDKQILVTDALSQITRAMPYFNKNVTTAFNDLETAQETNYPYVTCENRPENTTVIIVQMGAESKITQDSDNKCYILTLKSCEDNFLVAEKFILEIMKKLNEM